MELVTKKRLHLVAGRANLSLAEEIAERLGVALGDANLAEFANGELHCRFGESVRGTDVFIVQSHGHSETMSVNDALMEQLIMVDAAKRASAKRITVVCPYYGYGRQDRKAEGREPISAKLVADMFRAAGAKRLVSVDLHSGQIQGFFDGPVDHLTAMPVLVDHMATLGDDLVVVSPDAGRVKVAERYANALHADLAIVHKSRIKGEKNMVEARDVIGEVEGRTVRAHRRHDRHRRHARARPPSSSSTTAPPRCSPPPPTGCSRVRPSTASRTRSISRVVVTNTLPLPPEKQIDKIEVLSVAGIIADAIDAVFEDTSVSEIFGGANQT